MDVRRLGVPAIRIAAGSRLGAHRLALRERPYARMAENEEPGFRAVIWATTRHLKYAQYAPTNNNRTNSPMVSMSERLMRQLMLERR